MQPVEAEKPHIYPSILLSLVIYYTYEHMERKLLKIYVTSKEKEEVDKLAASAGMSHTELASRVYRWFAGQTDVIQGAILGTLPASVRADVARVVLERMASGDTPPTEGRRKPS